MFFNVDELTNLPRSYAGSCYAMIRSQLLDHLGVPDERFLMPLTESDDFELEQKIRDSIREHGGADLQILGIAGMTIGISREHRLAAIPGCLPWTRFSRQVRRDGCRRAQAGRPDTGDQDDHAEQADYSGGKGSTQGGDYKTGLQTCD